MDGELKPPPRHLYAILVLFMIIRWAFRGAIDGKFNEVSSNAQGQSHVKMHVNGCLGAQCLYFKGGKGDFDYEF